MSLNEKKPYTLSKNEATLSYLQRAIQKVAGEFSLSGCIIDTCENVDILIDGLERVLNCGRKSEFFGQTTYWEIISSMKKITWLQEPVQWIEKDIPNPSGRGSAFLRYCLNRKKTLDVYLAMLQSGIIYEYYESDCIFLRSDNHQLFYQQLVGLKEIDFSLSLNEADRKVKGVLTSTTEKPVTSEKKCRTANQNTELKKPKVQKVPIIEPKEPKYPEISNVKTEEQQPQQQPPQQHQPPKLESKQPQQPQHQPPKLESKQPQPQQQPPKLESKQPQPHQPPKLESKQPQQHQPPKLESKPSLQTQPLQTQPKQPQPLKTQPQQQHQPPKLESKPSLPVVPNIELPKKHKISTIPIIEPVEPNISTTNPKSEIKKPKLSPKKHSSTRIAKIED